MKLVADESVDFSIVKNLRTLGFDVLSISESHSGISDAMVLQLAFEKQQLLITEDKDFGELAHRMKMEHAGILLIRMNDLPRSERILKITTAIETYYPILLNKFSVLSANGLRLREA